jgi:predicted nuclease of restriction endonuclease-like (RecB) superfamily
MAEGIVPVRKDFINQIKSIISEAQQNALRAVDFNRVLMYWNIGKTIFEEEQQGLERAEYGTYLIKNLSRALEPEYGTSFSVRQLELSRQFYRTYPIANALRSQLNWTQYRLLIRIEDESKREYYIAEASKNNWTARQLERQINSQLYERLLLSSDKERVLAVANGQQQPEKTTDIIKDPMYLEFLGLKRETAYYEKDLEQAIITQLQEFLLEIGNGFAFVARQQRIHIDGDDFFADLVFYNRLLRCFVIIELKTHKLTHQDLGQLQMYVNYYDRYRKLPDENQTIGILLSADKNDAVVKITLPEDNKTILASQYKLYLPTEEALKQEIVKEMLEFKGKENIEADNE